MHQTTIPRSSNPQPRQYTDYAIPAARLDSGLNITLHFLFDKLRAVIPVPYCNSEAQGMRCHCNISITRGQADRIEKSESVGKVTSSYNAIRRYTGDGRVYTRRIHVATPPLNHTSSWHFYLSTGSTLEAQRLPRTPKCFKVSNTDMFLLTMCLRISYDTNITSTQPYLLTHNDAARRSDYTAPNIEHLTGKWVVKQVTGAVVEWGNPWKMLQKSVSRPKFEHGTSE